MNPLFRPMRPGVSLPPGILGKFRVSGDGAAFGALPGLWSFQLKLDEERAFLSAGILYNRHGARLPSYKERLFTPFIPRLAGLFPGMVVDLGLVGFRGQVLGGPGVVVFDVPGRAPWSERLGVLGLFPLFGGRVPAGEIVRLGNHADPQALFSQSRVPGVEGIVGRRLDAPYLVGDSKQMLKCRH